MQLLLFLLLTYLLKISLKKKDYEKNINDLENPVLILNESKTNINNQISQLTKQLDEQKLLAATTKKPTFHPSTEELEAIEV